MKTKTHQKGRFENLESLEKQESLPLNGDLPRYFAQKLPLKNPKQVVFKAKFQFIVQVREKKSQHLGRHYHRHVVDTKAMSILRRLDMVSGKRGTYLLRGSNFRNRKDQPLYFGGG